MPHGLVAFLGDLLPDTPAEIAAAAAGGYLLRGAGGALIRAGVKGATRGAVEGAASLGGKAAGKLAGAADRAILSAAARSPKVDRALYAATRAGERAAPKLRTAGRVGRIAAKPVTVPSGYAARHPGQGALGVNVGPGVFAAAKSGNPNAAIAPVEGYYRALTQNPGKVAGTTARTIEGFLAAPVGIAANAGISAATLNPGPITQQAKDIADFGVGMVKTFASGDPKKIQKAIEDQYGLTPLIMAGIPGSKLLARAGVNDAIGATLRKVPGIKRGLELKDNRGRRFAAAQIPEREQRQAISTAFGRTGKKEVPGLSTMGQALRHSENRGRKAGNVPDEHLVKSLAETGMNDKTGMGEAQIHRYNEVFGQRHPEVPAKRIVPADVAHQLLSDPSRLNDPALMRAVDHFRALQRDSGTETSLRAKYLKQALLVGSKLPEDRFLEIARNLGVSDALANKVDAALADALHQADTTGKDFSKILDEKAKESGIGRDLLARVDKAATDAFVKETQKKATALGLQEPAWTHDSNVLARGGNAYPAPVRGYRGRTSYNLSHRTYGVLQQKGLADQTYEALASGSVIDPLMRRGVNRSTVTFLEQESKPKPVGPGGRNVKIFTARQAEKAVRDGLIDPKTEMLLGSQNIKSAVLDPRIAGGKSGPVLDAIEGDTAQTLADEMHQLYAMKKKGVPGTEGPTFAVVDRVVGDEFVRQHQIQTTVPAKLQRAASRLILGYSPGWLIAQPVAEGAQGLAAVGLSHQIRGLREYQKLPPREQMQFDTVYGTTPGTSELPKSINEADSNIQQVTRGLRTTAPGRLAYDIVSGRGAAKIDRAKGLVIRRGVAAGHVSREFDKMNLGINNLMGEADRLRGLSKTEVMQHFATDPVARTKLESYVDDVMGNWTVMTARERKLAAVVIFYPFVRMSLQWAFHTFPARHPYKAAIQHFLAQENANKISQLVGGNPSIFQQWASAPLYTGPGNKADKLLPLWRVVPGANTFTEGIAGGENPALSAARAANPAFGIAASSFAGVDPLSGLRFGGSKLPSVGMMARLAGAQVANLPAPLRFADAMLANGGITRAIEGKRYSEAAQLFANAVESQRTRGERSFLMPFLPQSVTKQKLAARISRLLTDKYGNDRSKAATATAQLEALMAKYGVRPRSSSTSGSSGFSSGSSSSGSFDGSSSF